MSSDLHGARTEGHPEAGMKNPRHKTAALLGITLDRRSSELDGRSVVEVEIRIRPRSSRCALAPHAAEVSVFRPESRYHRLVLTAPEWAAFLADAKTGRYDVRAEIGL
jgi:hypothetical protein